MAEKTPIRLSRGVAEGNVFIGECIYCNSKTDLTNEHPIPFGLWGLDELEKGSCKECAAKTSKIELFVLRNTLGNLREYLRSPSRRQKKKKLRTGKATLTGKSTEHLEAPINDLVQYGAFPLFNYLPRKIKNELKGKKHKGPNVQVHIFKNAASPDYAGLTMPVQRINVTIWAQFLVKIAYGEYIRTVDKNFRSKRLSDFILTGKGDITNFIGGRSIAPRSAYMYSVHPYALPQEKNCFSIVSYIRLLPFNGTPSYLVHLGNLNGDELPNNIPVKHDWKISGVFPNYKNEILLDDVIIGKDWLPPDNDDLVS